MRNKKIVEGSLTQQTPAMTPEGREDQMVAYAMDLSERRMREGTASAQEICYWLGIGSKKERQQRQKLEEEIKLLKAKTEAIKSEQEKNVLYGQVLEAIRTYTPHSQDEI